MFSLSSFRSAVYQLHRVKVTQLRTLSSLPSGPCVTNKRDTDDNNDTTRRQLHSTPRVEADATAEVLTSVVAEKKTSDLAKRFTTTFEVTVSKIFPAGFCWQASSIVAGNQGFAPDTLNFALTTGTGDALGVLVGHYLYYAGKKMVQGSSSMIDMTKELHTGILLGSAAFCSGTAWQPIVNVLQGANLPFSQVFIGTWVGCGAAFYMGMRVGRTIFSGPLKHIHEPTYENSKNDVALSVAIGGATGFFVGTDAAYLPEQNFLINVVGIQPGVSDLTGCAIAGTSTGMGFVAAQSTMNMAFPAGKCWVD